MDFSWYLSQINLFYISDGKGYISNGMWKLNVMTVIKSYMNKASTSA